MDLARIYEYDTNVISTFGCYVKDRQLKKIKEKMLKTKFVFVPDNDEKNRLGVYPSIEALKKFKEKVEFPFWVLPVPAQYKDIGKMPGEEIKDLLNPTNYVEGHVFLHSK